MRTFFYILRWKKFRITSRELIKNEINIQNSFYFCCKLFSSSRGVVWKKLGSKKYFFKGVSFKNLFLKIVWHLAKKGSFDELAHVCITIPRDRAIANEERCSQDSSRFITGTRVILIGAFLLYTAWLADFPLPSCISGTSTLGWSVEFFFDRTEQGN